MHLHGYMSFTPSGSQPATGKPQGRCCLLLLDAAKHTWVFLQQGGVDHRSHAGVDQIARLEELTRGAPTFPPVSQHAFAEQEQTCIGESG